MVEEDPNKEKTLGELAKERRKEIESMPIEDEEDEALIERPQRAFGAYDERRIVYWDEGVASIGLWDPIAKHYTGIIEGCPVEVVFHESPFDETRREITITWQYVNGRRVRVGPLPFQRHVEWLDANGKALRPQMYKAVFSHFISVCEWQPELANARIEPLKDQTGFYFENGRIGRVGYKWKDPSEDDVREALRMLEDLARYYEGQMRKKMITVLKWNILAPYAYIKKNEGLGDPVFPWLYLWGPTMTGKTTLARIGKYVYEPPNPETDIGGSSFDTPARIGDQLEKTTFPLIVNEPTNALNKPRIADLIKRAIESPISRAREERGVLRNFKALAPVIFTANRVTIEDGAIRRRLYSIQFFDKEKVSREEKEEFERESNPYKSERSPLRKLRHIGAFAYKILRKRPDLLEQDWQGLADGIIAEAYKFTGLQAPTWVFEWFESSETYMSEEDFIIDTVREIILEAVNKAIRTSRWVDPEEGYYQITEDQTRNADLEEKIENALENRLIPFILPKKPENGVYVITTGIIREFNKRSPDSNVNLPRIADLFGWTWRRQNKLRNGKNLSGIIVTLKDIMELYKFEE